LKLFLDLDGVLVDFVGGWCKLYNVDYPYNDPKMLGIFYFTNFTKVEKPWEKTDEEFWANLQPMPDMERILRIIENFFTPEDVCILSSPAGKGSMEGKFRWVAKYLPQYKKQFLFGSTKEFAACPKRLLVDDANHNYDAWIKEGAPAILLPRPWNRLHFAEDHLGYLYRELERCTNGLS
jgi:5'(3')-deoxyribonucleotidase